MYTGAAPSDSFETDTPIDAGWWGGLLSDSRAAVQRFLDEDPLSPPVLRERVQAHVARLGRSTEVDTELATQLVRGLHGLLDAASRRPGLRPLAHVVVRYFESDLDDDLASAFGLDDDAEVFNAACGASGLDHLQID